MTIQNLRANPIQEDDLAHYWFDLPQERIAQFPIEPRDNSRMLVYHRDTKRIEHKHIFDLPEYLNSSDLIVRNNSKVIPARIFTKGINDGNLEIFLLEPLIPTGRTFQVACYSKTLQEKHSTFWRILCKPSKRFRVNDILPLPQGGWLEVVDRFEFGERVVRIDIPPEFTFKNWLEKVGSVPLPPYIERKVDDNDNNRYQTVYANKDGSVAAPTAGLHFTEALIIHLQKAGVQFADLTLHVGLGTFQPIKTHIISKHQILPETFELTLSTIQKLIKTKERQGRIFAIGTTTTRVLESFAWQKTETDLLGKCNLYIYPGHQFQVIDALLTNFHLPQSSLFVLVSAFIGRETALQIYKEAIEINYRFYSYGDACLFL